jgi:hypothetical protein
MNKQRSFSSLVSMVASVIGMAAFAPAAMADEPSGRHVQRALDAMVRESADAPLEIESPLPTRLASRRQQEDDMRDEYRRADYRRVKARQEPAFLDFSKFEIGGFVGGAAFSSDFEADPSYVAGINARVPVPGLPLGDWGIWGSILVSYLRRDLPFYYDNRNGHWYGAAIGGDYTFWRDSIFHLRGQLGILYAHWNDIQALDNGIGMLAGMEFGFYWIKNYDKAVFGINPMLSFDGDNYIFMLQLGFHVDF